MIDTSIIFMTTLMGSDKCKTRASVEEAINEAELECKTRASVEEAIKESSA